ncbi:hypothetical protein J3F83DRAFT_734808 [Trichoderma novae-zelandiae]
MPLRVGEGRLRLGLFCLSTLRGLWICLLLLLLPYAPEAQLMESSNLAGQMKASFTWRWVSSQARSALIAGRSLSHHRRLNITDCLFR